MYIREKRGLFTHMFSTMSVVIFVALALAGQVLAKPDRIYYHREVGIPLAKSIYEAEQRDAIGDNILDTRIVGGTYTSLGESPYLVGLIITLKNGNTTVCGSTLLSNTRLVTAAHCWFDGEERGRKLVAVLGSVTLFRGGVRIPSKIVQMHEDYNPDNLENDIAMINIQSVDYSEEIRNALLPGRDMMDNKFVGEWAKASGFGRNSSRKSGQITRQQAQRQARLRVIKNSECRRFHGSWVRETTLCTSALNDETKVGTCHGDSGGPLTIHKNGRARLIGVASFGHEICGQYPAGFTRVTEYTDWITEKLEE